MRSAAASAAPRASDTSRGSSDGPGDGTRAVFPDAGPGSAAKAISRSRAMARDAPASTRRNWSRGAGLVMPARSHVPDDAFGEIRSKHALVIFGDQGPLRLVALVEEGHAESIADVAEDERVLRPGDDR